MQNKKAQSVSLESIIITSIVLSLIILTYAWGQGMLDAQQTQATANYMESKLLDFRNAINEVSHEGIYSTRLVRFNMQEGSVGIIEGGHCEAGSINRNYIFFNISSKTAFVDSENFINIDPIEVNTDCFADYAGHSASVLFAKSEPVAGSFYNSYLLWHRQLSDNGNNYLVRLEAGESPQVTNSAATAVFRNSGTFNITGVITIIVTVDFI